MVGTEHNTPNILELQQTLSLRERQLKAIHDITRTLLACEDVRAIVRECLSVLLGIVDAESGSLLLYDPVRRSLVFHDAVGPSGSQIIGLEIDPNEPNGKAAQVFRTGESLITNSTLSELHDAGIDRQTGYITRNILTVPLRDLDREVIGVLQAVNKSDGSFSDEDRDILEILSALVATSIVKARLIEEAKLAAVARAVGDLGHDIKNALTPIETMVDTTIEAFVHPMYSDLDSLTEKWKDEDPRVALDVEAVVRPFRDWVPEMHSSVKDGCADIREMVSEIADYIKGAQSTHIVLNDIAAVVEERLRRLRVIAKSRRTVVHTEVDVKLTPFPFDKRLVGRALFNLVYNSLVAIEEAHRRGRLELRDQGFNIWVRVVMESGLDNGLKFCQIEVCDDGPGIPEKVRKSLFSAQTISTSAGGTGIGTRFVRSVAEAHGGTVGVESEIGNGARFWIRLPMETLSRT